MNYVYLIQEREFVRNKESVYKIGKTRQVNLKRFYGYPKGSLIIHTTTCDNCDDVEKSIIKLFDNKYKNRRDFGREYYEGDCNDMKDDINNIVKNQILYNKNNSIITGIMDKICDNVIMEIAEETINEENEENEEIKREIENLEKLSGKIKKKIYDFIKETEKCELQLENFIILGEDCRKKYSNKIELLSKFFKEQKIINEYYKEYIEYIEGLYKDIYKEKNTIKNIKSKIEFIENILYKNMIGVYCQIISLENLSNNIEKQIFYCEKCRFATNSKQLYDRHIKTRFHNKKISGIIPDDNDIKNHIENVI